MSDREKAQHTEHVAALSQKEAELTATYNADVAALKSEATRIAREATSA